MHRRCNKGGERRRHERRPLRAHAKLRAENGLRRGGSKTDNDARLNDADLRFQPGPAGVDFRRIRLLVNPPLAARFPFEVLHHVRDVNLGTVNPRFGQSFVQEVSGRPGGFLPGPGGGALPGGDREWSHGWLLVHLFQRSHAMHPAAASFNLLRVGRDGTKGAAVPWSRTTMLRIEANVTPARRRELSDG